MRSAVLETLGEEEGSARLQQAGYAAGADLARQFQAWLPTYADVDSLDQLDQQAIDEVFGQFFAALGWGSLEVDARTARGMALTTSDWAEAVGTGASYPSCHFTTGVLAGFLTAMADGQPLAAMEVACQQQGDERCRYLAGSPAILDAVYQAASEGGNYEAVMGM